MILGGPSVDSSRNSRKDYAREVMYIIGEVPKWVKFETSLSFDDSDLKDVKFPHNDPLVITPIIGNCKVK